MTRPFVLLNALKLHQGPLRLPTGNFQHVLHLAEALAARRDLSLRILTDADTHPHFAERIDAALLEPIAMRGNAVLRADFAVVSAARRLRPDIYHRPSGQLPFWTLKCKTVAGIADLSFLWLPHNPVKRAYKELSYRWTAQRADRIVCASNFTRDDVLARLNVPPEKLRVVHHGATALPRADPSLEAQVRSPFFLAFAHQRHKNAELAIHAIHRLQRAGHAARLAIVGDNDYTASSLKPLVRELRVEPHVHFVGVVSAPQLAWLYQQALALVFPTRFEGFGLPVLEAMRLECPVICSNVCSLPEIVGPAAVQVSPDDLEGLCGAMQKIATDRPFTHALRAAGRQRASGFTWESAAEQTARIYHELAQVNSP